MRTTQFEVGVVGVGVCVGEERGLQFPLTTHAASRPQQLDRHLPMYGIRTLVNLASHRPSSLDLQGKPRLSGLTLTHANRT